MSGNPFIPKKIHNTIIVDGRISKEIYENLKKLNLNIVPTIKCKEVPEPIAYHPDIVLHPVNYNTVIVAPNVFDYYNIKLSKLGISVIKGESILGQNYSEHIAYNVGRIGNFVIHNLDYIDKKLKYYLEKKNLEFIHVNQGYTKCSMAVVDEKAIITSDRPIYNKLIKLGIDVLLIEPGNIELKGYPYGFVGGTNGNISNKTIIFSGKFNNHMGKESILKFLKNYNKNVIWLSNENIIDIGTLITLYSQ